MYNYVQKQNSKITSQIHMRQLLTLNYNIKYMNNEKDRKEYKEKQCTLLMEAFQNDSSLEKLKPQFLDNINKGSLLYINPTVDSVKKCLKKKESAEVKFRALLFLKECMDTKNKAMGQYVQTKILSRLKEFAKLQMKPIKKAKDFTKESDDKTVQNFFQLLLECLNEWQVMYPIESGTQRDPSQFKKVQSELLEFGIRFPQKKVYFSTKPRLSESVPPPAITNLSKPQLQKIPSNPKELPPKPVPQKQLSNKPIPKLSDIVQQAKNIRDNSLSFFGILLELLADVENCQVIIDMVPDIQGVIAPLDENFINQLMSQPEEQIDEKMLEDLFQIKQITEDILKDISKVTRKNTVFPQLQKKYTVVIQKFLRSIEQTPNQQPKQPQQVLQPPEKPAKIVVNQQIKPRRSVEKETVSQIPQNPSQFQTDFAFQQQDRNMPAPQNIGQNSSSNNNFQNPFESAQNQDSHGNSQNNNQGFETFAPQNVRNPFNAEEGQFDQFGQGFQTNNFQDFNQKGQHQEFQRQRQNSTSVQPEIVTSIPFQQTVLQTEGFGFDEQGNNFANFPSPQPQQDNNFTNFTNPQPQYDNNFSNFTNPQPQQDKNFTNFTNPQVEFSNFSNPFPKLQRIKTQEIEGFQEPWSSNPLQDPYQAQNQSLDNSHGSNQNPLKKTDSFQFQNQDKDFVFQLGNMLSKEQSLSPLTPMTSQIRSQGQPFSNIMELENSQKQPQQKQDQLDKSQNRGGDSASEVGNLSQFPQDQIKWAFDDFQDFNLQNINNSMASQRQISYKYDTIDQVSQATDTQRKNVKKSQSFHDLTHENKSDYSDQQQTNAYLAREQEETPHLRQQTTQEPKKIPQANTPKSFVNFGTVEVQHDQNYSESLPSQKSLHVPPDLRDKQNDKDQVIERVQPKGFLQIIDQTLLSPILALDQINKQIPDIVINQQDNTKKSRKIPVQNVGTQVDLVDAPQNLPPIKEVEVQVICKQDPDQEKRHQQDKHSMNNEIKMLKAQNEVLTGKILAMDLEIKANQANDKFVKQKCQQISNKYVTILSQFSDASEQLNKSRINLQALQHQLHDTELQNKNYGEQLTEYIQKHQELREINSDTQNKYNSLVRAFNFVGKAKCHSELCSVSKYLSQILLDVNHKQEVLMEPELTKELSSKKKLDEQSISIQMDYNLFMRVYRAATENSQLENIKYACLMQRGVIFENQLIQFGVISKFNYNEQIQNNELTLQLNLYNKSPNMIDIHSALLDCPSSKYIKYIQQLDNCKQDPLNIQININSKQSIKLILPFTYSDNVQIPILSINVNQETYRIILPVIMTKFCVFQQCDQNLFMQNWSIMKEGQCKICVTQVDKPNQRLIRDIRDIRRYFHEMVEIRSKSNKSNWIGFGLLGKINNLHQVAIKFVRFKGFLTFKVMTHQQNENQGEYLLQTLLFLFNQ